MATTVAPLGSAPQPSEEQYERRVMDAVRELALELSGDASLVERTCRSEAT